MHLAAAAGDDFVVVWSSYGQDDFFSGAFGRRFSSTGVPQATEFQVNASTTASEYVGEVGVQSDGHFVVTWASAELGGSGLEISARRFDSAGAPQGVFRVNTFTSASRCGEATETDRATQSWPRSVGIDQEVASLQRSPRVDASERNLPHPRHHWRELHALRQRDDPRVHQRAGLTLDIDDDGTLQPLTDGLL
jgi:hypothetical protein